MVPPPILAFPSIFILLTHWLDVVTDEFEGALVQSSFPFGQGIWKRYDPCVTWASNNIRSV